MGDRTYCTLWIEGDLDEETRQLIHDELDPEMEEERWFGVSEVNYGELPDEVRKHLRERRLTYLWTWCAGDEYGDGLEIYLGGSNEYREFSTAHNSYEITLTVREASDLTQLEDAKTWQKHIYNIIR